MVFVPRAHILVVAVIAFVAAVVHGVDSGLPPLPAELKATFSISTFGRTFIKSESLSSMLDSDTMPGENHTTLTAGDVTYTLVDGTCALSDTPRFWSTQFLPGEWRRSVNAPCATDNATVCYTYTCSLSTGPVTLFYLAGTNVVKSIIFQGETSNVTWDTTARTADEFTVPPVCHEVNLPPLPTEIKVTLSSPIFNYTVIKSDSLRSMHIFVQGSQSKTLLTVSEASYGIAGVAPNQVCFLSENRDVAWQNQFMPNAWTKGADAPCATDGTKACNTYNGKFDGVNVTLCYIAGTNVVKSVAVASTGESFNVTWDTTARTADEFTVPSMCPSVSLPALPAELKATFSTPFFNRTFIKSDSLDSMRDLVSLEMPTDTLTTATETYTIYGVQGSLECMEPTTPRSWQTALFPGVWKRDADAPCTLGSSETCNVFMGKVAGFPSVVKLLYLNGTAELKSIVTASYSPLGLNVVKSVALRPMVKYFNVTWDTTARTADEFTVPSVCLLPPVDESSSPIDNFVAYGLPALPAELKATIASSTFNRILVKSDSLSSMRDFVSIISHTPTDTYSNATVTHVISGTGPSQTCTGPTSPRIWQTQFLPGAWVKSLQGAQCATDSRRWCDTFSGTVAGYPAVLHYIANTATARSIVVTIGTGNKVYDVTWDTNTRTANEFTVPSSCNQQTHIESSDDFSSSHLYAAHTDSASRQRQSAPSGDEHVVSTAAATFKASVVAITIALVALL